MFHYSYYIGKIVSSINIKRPFIIDSFFDADSEIHLCVIRMFFWGGQNKEITRPNKLIACFTAI